MARTTSTQTNWFGGQIAEQRHGYASDQLYFSSSALIKNLVVRPTGSLTRRPGTKFVARTDSNAHALGNETNSVRLVPFVFGHESASNYVLEFGHRSMTVTASSDSGIKFTTTSAHGLIVGDIVNFSATSSFPTNITANTDYYVKDVIDTTNFRVSASISTETVGSAVSYSSAGSGVSFDLGYIKYYKDGAVLAGETNAGTDQTHLRLTGSPFNTASKLKDMQYVQSADIIFLVSPNVQPYKLSRYSNTSDTAGSFRTKDGGSVTTGYRWVLEPFVIKDGPYLEQQEDERNGNEDVTIDISNPSATHTATSDGTGFINKKFLTPDSATNQSKLDNAWYDTTAGGASGVPNTDANVSYLQLKNHGLNDGMYITLTDSGSSGHPSNGNYYVVNATANTFKLANATDLTPETFTNAEKPKIYARYYPKGATLQIDSSANLFSEDDVGRLFRFSPFKRDTIYWVYGEITAYASATRVTITLKVDCPVSDSNAIETWKLGAWYTENYPHHISIFQQRMVFARNRTSPQTVWFSETGAFESFAPSQQEGTSAGETATGSTIVGDQIIASNGMTFTFDSGTIDEIQWLVSQEKLLAGSTGGIYAVYGSEQDLTITPFNFTIKREGTQPAQTGANAVAYDSNALYIQGTGKKVRVVTFGDMGSGASSADITTRATDILAQSAKQVVETDIPNFVSWFRMGDGTLVGLTYIPQLEIISWHTHELVGNYSYSNTREGDPTGHLTTDKSHAVILDMCTIPSSSRDQLWVLVRRTIPVADTVTNAFTPSDSSGSILFTDSGHGLSTGDKIKFSTTGSLPGNILTTIEYYVTKVSDNTFTVSTSTSSDDTVAWSSAGSSSTWYKPERIIESVEVMEDWMSTESIADSKYLDGHVIGSGVDLASGKLSHLEGETVDILGDGSVFDSQVVNNSGTLTTDLGSSQTTLIVGMGYLSRLITLPIAQGPTGNIRIGNMKRVHRGWAKLFRTPNFKYAIYTSTFADSDLAESVTRTIADLYGTAPTMASDTRELIPLSQGFTDGQFLLQQTDPLPLNILALELDYETNDN